MSRGPAVRQLPVDITEEVLDTPDLAALRAYDPRTEGDRLNRTLASRSEAARRQNSERRFDGITSQAARRRLQQLGDNDINAAQSLGVAEGTNELSRLRLGQLTGLAGLTRGTRRHGFESQQRQRGGFLDSFTDALGSTLGRLVSDERMKQNIRPSAPVLPRLAGMQAHDYEWRETGEPDTGVVAQDLAQQFPEAVVPGDEQQPWMVKPETEAALALQGLRELNEKVDMLAQAAGLMSGAMPGSIPPGEFDAYEDEMPQMQPGRPAAPMLPRRGY